MEQRNCLLQSLKFHSSFLIMLLLHFVMILSQYILLQLTFCLYLISRPSVLQAADGQYNISIFFHEKENFIMKHKNTVATTILFADDACFSVLS